MIDQVSSQELLQGEQLEGKDDSSEFLPDEPSELELTAIELASEESEFDEAILRQLRLEDAMDRDDLEGIYLSQPEFHLPLLTREQEFELGTTTQYGRDAAFYMITVLADEFDGSEDSEFAVYVPAAQSLAKHKDDRTTGDSKRIEKAYLLLINHHLHLVPDNISEIILAGLEARNTLVNRNLRLAAKIALKYQSLPVVQEANLGLITAANKYDHTKGFKFGTYATWWVRQKIFRYFQESRQIAIPSHANDTWRKIDDLNTRLIQELHLENIPDIVLAERAIEEGIVQPTNPALVVDLIVKMRRAIHGIPSLEEPLDPNSENEAVLGDMVEDKEALIPGGLQHTLYLDLFRYLEILDERQLRILYLRYVKGLSTTEVAPLIQNLGNSSETTITRQRVSQLEREALNRLWRTIPSSERLGPRYIKPGSNGRSVES